jgi:hypothetical protein
MVKVSKKQCKKRKDLTCAEGGVYMDAQFYRISPSS